jgi:hypothetical protein
MSQPPPSRNYAAPGISMDHVRLARIFRRIATWCAVVPMALGAAIVLAYWVFDWDALPGVGLVMLPLGGLTVLTGLIFVLLWFLQERALFKKIGKPVPHRAVAVMTLLLLSNFLVAFACMWVGIGLAMEPQVFVTVQNKSGATVSRCVISARWKDKTAVLAPGEEMTVFVRVRRAKSLSVRVEQAGKVREMPLGKTAAAAYGGVVDVTVEPDLELKVKSEVGSGWD